MVSNKTTKNNKPDFNITSEQDTIVGKEKAVRLEGNLTSMNITGVTYVVLHDQDAYYLLYAANVNDYHKYLPEFEAMVKSFRFEN